MRVRYGWGFAAAVVAACGLWWAGIRGGGGSCGTAGWLRAVFGGCPECRTAPLASIPEQALAGRNVVAPDGDGVSNEEARARVLQLIDQEALGLAPALENPWKELGPTADEPPPAEPPGMEPAPPAEGASASMPYAEEDATPVMPYAPDVEEAIDARFDLWMLLFPLTPVSEPVPAPRPPNSGEQDRFRESLDSVNEEQGIFLLFPWGKPLSKPARQAEALPVTGCPAACPYSGDGYAPSRKSPPPLPMLRTPREREECPAHPEVDTMEFRPSDTKKGESEAFQRRPW
jgi:hypothetical protein